MKAEISTAGNQNTSTIHHGLAHCILIILMGVVYLLALPHLLFVFLYIVLLISGCYGELTGSNIRANGLDYSNANHKV